MDLNGYFYPDCYLCEGGAGGASHTRSGVHYSAVCSLCAEMGVSAVYNGESGRSGYYRTKQHKSDIINSRTTNAFAKHLEVHHKEAVGKPEVFKFKSERVYKKCLDRKVAEGVAISNSDCQILLNSRSEYHQPAVTRVTTTREVRSNGS